MQYLYQRSQMGTSASCQGSKTADMRIVLVREVCIVQALMPVCSYMSLPNLQHLMWLCLEGHMFVKEANYVVVSTIN